MGSFPDPYYVAPLPPAFGGPNLVSAIPDTAVLHGGSKSFNVTSHFNATKTPASTFKYFVTTNNKALLEVRNQEDGTFELVSLNTSGIATVRVKAVAVERDVDVWAATSTFTVSVVVDEHDPTRTPTAWPDVRGPHILDLTQYFADADGVEQLTFSATSSDSSVVTATVTETSIDTFEPKPAMHLTFESAAAGDGPRDVVPTGVTVGAYSRSAEGIAAYGSYAADFDGAGYFDTGYAFGTGTLTAAVWFKGEFDERVTDNVIMGTADAIGVTDWILIEARSGTAAGLEATDTSKMKINIYVVDGGTWYQYLTTELYDTADWQHVVLMTDGLASGSGACTAKLYVNGAEKWSKDLTSSGSCPFDHSTQTLGLAGTKQNSGARHGDRYYDELQVWDSALTAQQISDLYATFTTP
jgi:hypothetical protein